MYAFSIWRLLMPASFSRRTVKLPFLLVLIEHSPRSRPTPSCIAHLSLFVGSQCGCPFHWLWESTSSYLFVPWHGHDALDQAGHLEAGTVGEQPPLSSRVTRCSGSAKDLHTAAISHLWTETIHHWHLIYLTDKLQTQSSEWHRPVICKRAGNGRSARQLPAF